MANQLGDAPTKIEEEQSMTSWTPSEKENSKSVYGCDILIENDLTRSQKEVRIFNMYWDKFRENLKGIGFGMGRTDPKLWRLEPPTPIKKRK